MYWYYIECNMDFSCADWFHFDRLPDIKTNVYHYRSEAADWSNTDSWTSWTDGGFIERGRIECRTGQHRAMYGVSSTTQTTGYSVLTGKDWCKYQTKTGLM